MVDYDFMMRVAKIVNCAGDKLREDAAYAGSYNDGGGQRLKDQAHFFINGLNQTLPEEWHDYVVQAHKEKELEELRLNSVDYAQYLKLKKKFGHLED